MDKEEGEAPADPTTVPLGSGPEEPLGEAEAGELFDAAMQADRGDIAAEGAIIGRYKLQQKLGEGGFGEVWMAQQTQPMVRRVALKIVKLGMDTKEVIARFDAERQALAMMNHPEIAKVFDAGATASGRPYFVMELVRGEPITNYCDSQKLDTRQRLELFKDVCAALEHAHQKGIIHRDIKPSNIMVADDDAGKPGVKVIDFGIAKAVNQPLTDKTLFTRIGQFMGTPTYMSPEQAGQGSSDIDARSDVYSLGVLLYEILAGKPPFDAMTLAQAGYEEMQRIIREDDPPKPSTRLSSIGPEERSRVALAHRADPAKLSRTIRGDLDWIVMKALEKSRSRRYASAGAFAEDIGRFLNHQPVNAAPPSPVYRLQKFVRRRWVLVSGVLLLLGGVIAGIVVGRLGDDTDLLGELLKGAAHPLSISGLQVVGEETTLKLTVPPIDPPDRKRGSGLFIAIVGWPEGKKLDDDAAVILFPHKDQKGAWIPSGEWDIPLAMAESSKFGIIAAIGDTSEDALRKFLGEAYDRAKEELSGEETVRSTVMEKKGGDTPVGFGYIEVP